MKQLTPIEELTPLQCMIDWMNKHDFHCTSQAQRFAESLLAKEKEVIVKSVNDTIDAYSYFTESPHNPPPMNGEDYYNNKYSK
jgi:hypothetical protein